MKIIPLYGKELDSRGSEFIRPLRSSQVTTVSTPVTADEEEGDEPKPLWRACGKCNGEPNDGQFRLINLRWGLGQSCRVCKREEREAVERARFTLTSGSVEALTRAFLKRERVRIDRRGNILLPRERKETP